MTKVYYVAATLVTSMTKSHVPPLPRFNFGNKAELFGARSSEKHGETLLVAAVMRRNVCALLP